MTTNHGFERQLNAWLREDAAQRVPEHLTEVLVRTDATRQRRWWTSPARWLPVDLTAPRAALLPVGAWRVLAVVAAVVLLVVALIALAVGSRHQLPLPFGPARNGLFVTGINGDLFTVDPRSGTKSPLFSDAPEAFDFGPGFSRDGTRLLFLRTVAGRGMELVVADPSGRNAIAVTPFVEAIDQVDWSPDGSRLVYLQRVAGRDRIVVVNADGTANRTLELPFSANQVSWLPPDGRVILFRREHQIDSDPPPAIFTVDPDDGRLSQLSAPPAADENDLNDVSAAPDGTRILYRESPPTGPFRIHILTIATGKDLVLPAPVSPAPPENESQTSPGFSPDGTHVVYLRFYPDGLRLVVAPADGSSTGTVLPLRGGIGDDGPTINNYAFTPDGTAIVANELATRDTWLLPVDGSPGTVLAHGVVPYDAISTVQRLAP